MSTPRYVKGAVRAFIEEDRREFLIQQFENGIPLFEYPESRKLIVDALKHKKFSPRGKGHSLREPEKESLEIGAVLEWAILEGAGFPRYGDSNKADVIYGYEIVQKRFDFTLYQLKKYWGKYHAKPEIKAQLDRHIEFGKKFKESLRKHYLEQVLTS